MTTLLRKQSGQAMTEYIIIVALIAIASIGVFMLLGWTIRPQQAAIATELAGGDGSRVRIEAYKSARAAVQLGRENKTLDSYMVNPGRSANP